MKLKLAEWRRARNITQDEMAKSLNIAKPTYVRWEKRPELIPVTSAFKIAEIFDVEITNILFLP